ncbi:ATP-binding protein [Methylobacterium iners]|uniref:histidine kinase n=1 Tax=Methylobacterium iners TaxID=418707 RepID=A0ABQ4S821_9HYPH|nr:ATP-binding protein [Methylobacterium iners]GJD98009.1 Adaptive-response sensory-kinase SasA [Methylobacterium iners]
MNALSRPPSTGETASPEASKSQRPASRPLPSRVRRWLPSSIGGQITLLVSSAIIVAHIVIAMLIVVLREPWRDENHPVAASMRVATVARLLDAAEPVQRANLLRDAARSLPNLRLAPWEGHVPGNAAEEAGDAAFIQRLRDYYAQPLTVVELPGPPDAPGQTVGVSTQNGARFSVFLPPERSLNPRRGVLIFSLLFLGSTLLILSVWAARALTAPLGRLAEAAEAFGTRADLVALPEKGPKEVLAVSRALDRMRERVRRLIDDRTQMLAAISHDLRTPITRMRLRAEFVEDDQARGMMLRDLGQMNGLVEAALAFIRDEGAGRFEAPALIDLASVVQTVCDGFADVGADVELEQARHVLVQGRADELQRAITNLVDNAVKYGGRARVRMGPAAGGVSVEVIDDGPGIPDDECEAMLKPFVRGDRARGLNEANGFGLGLSIVGAIVEGHGGRLILTNRQPRGFIARIELPLAAARMARRAGGEARTG